MKHFLLSLLLMLCTASLAAEDSQHVLNILDLGAKNDGSADISGIVNENTSQGAIFLPAGLYRVDHPLHLKNPIRGEGYARNATVTNTKTWLLSQIESDENAHGVLEYGEVGCINVENLNIQCHSMEDGIRIEPCSQRTMTFISHVGVYSTGACGIRIVGGGSRPVFVEDATIFGRGPKTCSVGLEIGAADCRLSHIEVMGTQTGMVVRAGYTYGSNLHLWTGAMGKDEDGTWWKGTRGIVLTENGVFTGSQIYPDTNYIVFEQKGHNKGGFDISEILYYDDASEKASQDKDGMLFHADEGCTPNLSIHGGIFAVCGNEEHKHWMSKLYTPGMNIDNVLIRTDRAMCGDNIDVLCMGDALPDYTLEYADKGWCKVADIFDKAPSGLVQADLSTDSGAAWKVSVLKRENGKKKVKFEAQSPICKAYRLKYAERDGLVKIFLFSPDEKPMKARFTTRSMGSYFRPADYGWLRAHNFSPRYREVE